MDRVFLTAEWRYLAMLNYRVPPELLQPLVPRGTELDLWKGHAYVSVVGFLFKDIRVFGVRMPFHHTFEEVNLRFYVRRESNGEIRRGVTFIRELVPHRSIAHTAWIAYNEPYRPVRMRHTFGVTGPAWRPMSVEYGWRARATWSRLRLSPVGSAFKVTPGSEEEFITEHYWGYTRSRLGGTNEYEVRHAPWVVWRAKQASLDGNLSVVFGPAFANILSEPPHSAFLAEGSPVSVLSPTRLRLRGRPRKSR